MTPKIHIFHYRGVAITYESGLYRIQLNPTVTYLLPNDCFKEIDRVKKQMEENIINLSGIIHQNKTDGKK